jgi:hypothetical protein
MAEPRGELGDLAKESIYSFGIGKPSPPGTEGAAAGAGSGHRTGTRGARRTRGGGDLQQVLRVVDLFGIEETVQLANAGRVAHLAQCLGLDLPNAFASHLELLADLLERPAVAVDQAEPQREHPALALRERIQNVDDLFPQERVGRHVVRIFRRLVLDEIAEARVIAVAHRRLQ